ncbi:VOC family protein [Lentzea kentuckyensis]|uniref:VOC family protein n=1 Tax=Lentzea kentuckyensis TaxID=360086 RepID=UPI000A388022|nr:VOC family protein [Lentzea kentuckyensis]
MNVVPDGYHTVTPWLITRGHTAELIEFIEKVFGATELGRVGEAPNIGHAEVRIGDSVVMLFDVPHWPKTPAFLRLYVEDDKATLAKATNLGATVVTEPTELFWGDRVSRFADPFGNLWWIHQRVAEPTAEELNERMREPRFVEAMNYVQSVDFTPRT